MATKYDIFEFMYDKGIVKVQDILNAFQKSKTAYSAVYQLLIKLEKEKLIGKSYRGFQIIYSEKNRLLFKLIRFCVSNNINYNQLLDEGIVNFIKNAFEKRKFSINDFHLNPRTFKSYINCLHQNGFLIVFSCKPLFASLPYNSFLGDLLRYFGNAVLIEEKNEEEYLEEIKKDLQIFKRLRKKNERKYKEITEKHEIKFIQHSLNLEGNPITLPETIRLLQDHMISKDMKTEYVLEVNNYQKAVNLMLHDSAEKIILTKQAILNYHFIAMQHLPEIAGKIRNVAVFIKNNLDFKVASVKDVEEKLNVLLEKYNKFIGEKHSFNEIFFFSSYFHNEFQHIHPFVDGNSRITRIITFHLLRSLGIPIIDIPIGLLEGYLFSSKGAKKRNDKKLNHTLQLIILYNLKLINEQLK